MARDFGKVRVKFWADERVQAWPERLKFVALYLLTSEHSNALGAFRLPLQYASADTGLSVKEIGQAFGDLEAEGFMRRCDKTHWIFLSNYLEHNQLENGKVGAHALKLALAMPRSIPFLKEVEEALTEALRLIGTVWGGFGYRIDTLSKPDRTPEPEPEPEPKPEPEMEKAEVRSQARASAEIRPKPISKPVLSERTARSFEHGTRWPAEAVVPDDWIEAGAAARLRHQLPMVDLRLVAEQFADYWAAESGSHAVKLDWRRTWLKWATSQKVQSNGFSNARQPGHRLGDFGPILEREHTEGADREPDGPAGGGVRKAQGSFAGDDRTHGGGVVQGVALLRARDH